MDAEQQNSAEQQHTYSLADDIIQCVLDALHENAHDSILKIFDDLGPVDIAELLSKINDEQREKLLTDYADLIPSVAYTELDAGLRQTALQALEPEQLTDIVSDLDSDDALELIENLDENFQSEITQNLPTALQHVLEEGLSYPEDSAGRLMQREYVAVPEHWTVGQTIDYFREEDENLPGEFFDVFVVSPSHKVMGEIPLSRLLRSVRTVKLNTLTLDDTHPIPATIDQEEVAKVFMKDNLSSAPVVDDMDRLIGVITIDDVVDVIDEEAEEDLMKLGGVEQDDLYSAVLSTTFSRFRWLFLNLLTAILASMIISLFDATLETIVAVAILMPIVASMGGNAGTQALTVAVRALATNEVSKTNAFRIIWKETVVGMINGFLFALIMGIIATFWFHNSMLGIVIAIAMITNLIIAGLFGAGIPIMLSKMGSDPAVSSTVFLTTATDIIGFFVFLGLATLILTT